MALPNQLKNIVVVFPAKHGKKLPLHVQEQAGTDQFEELEEPVGPDQFVAKQVVYFNYDLNDMVEYEDWVNDMDEKHFPEFEKDDVKVVYPTRKVKNSYPKKRFLSKKTKASRAKRISKRSRTHQHGDRDWGVQITIEQDAVETMRQQIKDDDDDIKQEIEEEIDRLAYFRHASKILKTVSSNCLCCS